MRVVAGVVVRSGCVLLGRRAAGRREAGAWELPGGKMEPGETEAGALRREWGEELSVGVTPVGVLGEVEHAYPHATIVLVAVLARLDGEPVVGPDHDALAWVPLAEVPSWGLAPADLALWAGVAGRLAGAPASEG